MIDSENKTTQIQINQTGIAYNSDREITFKRQLNSSWTQWIDVENEHFMVWMSMETFPKFYKKWGHYDYSLKKSSYLLEIEYNWDVNLTEVLKSFVISSAQELGSSSFFGWSLILSGGMTLVSIFVLVVTASCQKKAFREEDLIWD